MPVSDLMVIGSMKLHRTGRDKPAKVEFSADQMPAPEHKEA